MKKIKLNLLAASLSFFVMTSCDRASHLDTTRPVPQETAAGSAVTTTTTNDPAITGKSGSSEPCTPNAYIVTLESRTAVTGGWEWIWSVQNSNPGNGNNGTFQDLSHWGMQFGPCFNIGSMLSAAYSADGNNWTAFTPSYQSDPSQSCMTTPVLKYDFGTSGAAKSYYKLVVDADYATGTSNAYYKSGGNTGCCTFSFNGIACADDGGDR